MYKNAGPAIISALHVRTNLGKLLRQIEEEHCSFVIEKRGIPTAVLLSIRDYIRLGAPEPEVLKGLGQESQQNRTSNLTARQIDKIIKTTRAQRKRR